MVAFLGAFDRKLLNHHLCSPMQGGERVRPLRCGFASESSVGVSLCRAARGMPCADAPVNVSRSWTPDSRRLSGLRLGFKECSVTPRSSYNLSDLRLFSCQTLRRARQSVVDTHPSQPAYPLLTRPLLRQVLSVEYASIPLYRGRDEFRPHRRHVLASSPEYPGEPITRENPMSDIRPEDEAAIRAVLVDSYKAWRLTTPTAWSPTTPRTRPPS